jgi:hypothetical protein
MARITFIPNRVIDSNGISDGASIYVWLSGTETPVLLFSDENRTISVPNPYVVPAGAAVPVLYYDDALDVRVRVVEATSGTVIQDDDHYASVVFASEVSDALIQAADSAAAAEAAAEAAEAVAEQAAFAASTEGFYPDARSFVPQGATGHDTITGGSGGTNGTFSLAFSGGNFDVNPSGTFTVSGGAVTAITLTGPGLYIGNSISAPTLDFSASSGLTGASATLTTGYLVGSGEYYTTTHATDSDLISLFQNVGGVATEIISDYPVSAARAITAAVTAEDARDETIAVLPNLNTLFAEQSLATLLLADAVGYNGAFRAAGPGAAFTADFSTETYTHGIQRMPLLPGIEFTRSGTGVAMAGGASETFDENTPRIIGNKLFIDGGGTNIVPNGTDISNAAWVKTNFGTPTLTTGPGGANTAYAIRETTTNGGHNLTQSITGLSAEDQFTIHWLMRPVGRDYGYVGFQNASTTKNVTARFSFLTKSFLSSYPASSGGASALDGGILDYGDGYYLVWLTGTFSATETGIRPYCGTMSNSTTASFAGDTSKGLDVAAIWGVQGSGTPVNFLTASRSAETFDVPLGAGWYISRMVDGEGETVNNLQIEQMGDRWSLAPRFGNLWVEEAQVYTAAMLDDTSTQSDTSDGATITPTQGPDLVPYKYPGSYPMEAATNGRITSGKYELTPQSGEDGTTYWVVDLGEGGAARYAKATLYFDAATAGSEAISNMSFAIGFSNDLDNLIQEMPVHAVFTSEGFVGQHRMSENAGAFVTRSQLQRHDGGSGVSTDVSVALHGDKLTMTMWGQTITTQDPLFNSIDCRYVFFEIQATSNNTTRTIRFADPVVSMAEVGPEPEYSASEPQNISDPTHPFALGTAVAGNTYTIQRGYWTSNDGQITFSQQWQFDMVDIPGATSTSYATTNGVDEGKKIRVGERATNDSGTSSFVYSPESAALA